MPYKDPQKQKEWNRRYNASPPGKMAKRKRQQKYAAKARASLLESRRLAAEALGMTAPLDEAEVQTKAQELAHTKGILGGGGEEGPAPPDAGPLVQRLRRHHWAGAGEGSVQVPLLPWGTKSYEANAQQKVSRSPPSSLLDLLLAADLALFSLWRYMSDHKLCRPPLVNAATGKTLGAKKFKKLFMCKTIYTTIHHADVTR